MCLLALTAMGTTSCEDWLTLYPQDRVVEEDFWEDKNDLEGVRYAAYKQMCSTLDKFIIWGDLRSDSYEMNNTRHDDQKQYDVYREIMNTEPDSSMTQFDWSGVYMTINFCNKVLQHGEEILEKDKQFTPGEWSQMKAEMVGLRALNYFYLLRAFKDIPYTTQVINKDVEVTYFGLTNQLVVLDSLIVDVEKVAGFARNRFTNNADSKGLITNSALYAMLSDMYLWRASLHEGRYSNAWTDTVQVDTGMVVHSVQGDYQKCIEYGAKALDILEKNNKQNSSSFGSYKLDKIDYGLAAVGIPNCNMIENDFDNVANGASPQLDAAEEIFGVNYISSSGGKNSEESIFELQFSTRDDRKSDVLSSFYDQATGTHLVVCQQALSDALGTGDGATLGTSCYDSRMWYSACNRFAGSSSNLGDYYCMKWTRPVTVTVRNGQEVEVRLNKQGYSYSNWIVYRMTDVMLMMAEAYAAMGGTANNRMATYIVNAIHRRSYCNLKTATTIPSEDITSSSTVGNATNANPMTMVLNERQLEFLGEGKRWFDLVRYAERNAGGQDGTVDEREWTEENPIGSGYAGVKKMMEDFMQKKYSGSYTVHRNRTKNRYGLYCPIYYMEVKASNGNVQQNPVWNKSKYDN